MHDTAVDAHQAGSMHRAVLPMAAAATVFAEQCLTLLSKRFAVTLVPEPKRKRGGLHDDDFAFHMRVLGAAELRTLDQICAGLGGLEPHRLVLAGQASCLIRNAGMKKLWMTSCDARSSRTVSSTG